MLDSPGRRRDGEPDRQQAEKCSSTSFVELAARAIGTDCSCCRPPSGGADTPLTADAGWLKVREMARETLTEPAGTWQQPLPTLGIYCGSQ